METERAINNLEELVARLQGDIRSLEYKVQQLEYYKADEKHSHSEYERR
uniref:Uncharacterized protein n=1 Tax=viral metagenome TaxID=1070528 RepID=A0A6M3LAV3_9ZZZZ